MSRWTIKVTREIFFMHLQENFPSGNDFINHINEKIRSYSVYRDEIPQELINWISLAKRDIAFYMESCINWIDTKNNDNNYDPMIGYKIEVYSNGRHGHKTLRKTLIIQSEYDNSENKSKCIKIKIIVQNNFSEESIKYINGIFKNISKKYPNLNIPYNIKNIYYTIGQGYNDSSYYYRSKDFEVINILEMIESMKNDIFIEDKSEFKETIGYIPMSELKLNTIFDDILKMTKEKEGK